MPSDMWASFSRDTISKTPAELLPEDKTSRMNVSYEAEAAIVRGKYVKKEHVNRLESSLKKEIRIASNGIFPQDWRKSMLFVLNT